MIATVWNDLLAIFLSALEAQGTMKFGDIGVSFATQAGSPSVTVSLISSSTPAPAPTNPPVPQSSSVH